MKKNDWILLLSIFLYSFLFYEQFPGLNFVLFSVAVLSGLLISGKVSINQRWWVVAAGCIVSSVFIAIYSSPLAIVANVFSLALLSALSVRPDSSVLVSLFLSFASAISSVVFMILDWMARVQKPGVRSRPLYVTLIMFSIIFLITLLFFVMYQSSNPLFQDLTKNINLDFISWPWVFFTLGGLVLLYGFYYNRNIELITQADENAPASISKEYAFEKSFMNDLFKMDTEYVSGIILLSVLNLMLLIVNGLDLHYLWFDGKLPENVDHKQFVHNGVGVLVTSIILAIIIMLYYFRGRLNYKEETNHLKWLAIFWIVQNSFMIFSTAYRTNMYVSEFGLSYKKIGVFVYLLLTLIGLITTFYKLRKNRSNWFLVRFNSWAWYLLLVVACVFNWDMVITNFNINKAYKENKKLEKYYLADLSFKNLPRLIQLPDSAIKTDDFGTRDYYSQLKGKFFYSFKSGMDNKLYSFLKEMEYPDWRSWCYEKSRVLEDLQKLAPGIKALQLQYAYNIDKLSPLKLFSSLEDLNLSNNKINPGELFYFPKLKKLSLSECHVDSLEEIAALSELEELDLAGNMITDVSVLNRFPALRKLDVSRTSLEDLNALQVKNIESLNLSGNAIDDLNGLKNFTRLRELDLTNVLNGTPLEIPEVSSLEKLNLGSNQISKLNVSKFMSDISGCRNLKQLDLSNNGIVWLDVFLRNRSEISDSANALFPKLESLILNNNGIIDVAPLKNYVGLQQLDLSGNQIRNPGKLFALQNLATLNLRDNLLETITGISRLKDLQWLNLSNCGIKQEYKEIGELQALKTLALSGNIIADIEPFCKLHRLTFLDLSDNKIKSISGIEQLKDLEHLDLRKNKFTDYSPLYAMKKLKVLYIDVIAADQLLKLKKVLPNCSVYSQSY